MLQDYTRAAYIAAQASSGLRVGVPVRSAECSPAKHQLPIPQNSPPHTSPRTSRIATEKSNLLHVRHIYAIEAQITHGTSRTGRGTLRIGLSKEHCCGSASFRLQARMLVPLVRKPVYICWCRLGAPIVRCMLRAWYDRWL
jgi:hypothetical protein